MAARGARAAERADAAHWRAKGVANDSEAQDRLVAFRQALERLGWTENVNVRFDYRWAPKGPEEARTFTKELIDLKPDLIFVQSTPMTVAAKEVVAGFNSDRLRAG